MDSADAYSKASYLRLHRSDAVTVQRLSKVDGNIGAPLARTGNCTTPIVTYRPRSDVQPFRPLHLPRYKLAQGVKRPVVINGRLHRGRPSHAYWIAGIAPLDVTSWHQVQKRVTDGGCPHDQLVQTLQRGAGLPGISILRDGSFKIQTFKIQTAFSCDEINRDRFGAKAGGVW